jgi:hypothetical protein
MNRKFILGSILSLVLLGSTMNVDVFAETFQQSILLNQGAGKFNIGDLGIGDDVVLNLVNPTNQPLTFRTTENLGNEQCWTVPPNSSRVVSFAYTRPFDDDVEFVVEGPAGGTPIAQGTLIPAHYGQRPVSYPTTGGGMHQQSVRGYW